MTSRDFSVHPAQTVTDAKDQAAVLLKTGIAAVGMSIAEARFISQQLARSADEVECQLALRERLANERRDEPRYSRWDEVAALEAGKPLVGEM